jgi:protein gp37
MPHKLREPYRLKEPSRVFVNSMSDLFHERVPDDYIKQVFQVMADLPQHTFQILTKRAERAARWLGPWLPNIWMGVSVEDSRAAHRIDTLRRCHAKVLFISYEPALGPLGDVNLWGYHWLICGGESGPGFRSLDMAWARQSRGLCRKYGLAFYFKQDSGYRTELRPYLVEEDGSHSVIQEYPAIQPAISQPALL